MTEISKTKKNSNGKITSANRVRTIIEPISIYFTFSHTKNDNITNNQFWNIKKKIDISFDKQALNQSKKK